MPTEAESKRQATAQDDPAVFQFVRDGVPRVFAWIEWAGFIALLRYVGTKYDVAALSVIGGFLMPCLALHMNDVFSNWLISRFKGRTHQRRIMWIGIGICMVVGLALWWLMTDLITALISAQNAPK